MKIFNKLVSIFGKHPSSRYLNIKEEEMQKVNIERGTNMTHENMFSKESSGRVDQSIYTRRRRYPRFSVEGMGVHSKMIFTESIRLFNMSIGGACILTKNIFDPGKKILVRLKSDRIYGPLKAMTVWRSSGDVITDENGNPIKLYKAGIQFKDISSETLVLLKDFMRLSGVPEEKTYSEEYKPSALRYVIKDNEEAILHYPEDCDVKIISLSGMLVETDHKLEIEHKYQMALFIPNEDEPIKFRGRIASLFPVHETTRYNTGIEFLDLSENNKARLKRFIAYLSVRQFI